MRSVARRATLSKQTNRILGHPSARAVSEYPGALQAVQNPQLLNSPQKPATSPPQEEKGYHAPPYFPKAKLEATRESVAAANSNRQTPPVATPPALSARH